MGLDLIYLCGESRLKIRLTQADWKTLFNLREIAPEAVNDLIEVPEPGVIIKVKLERLRKAVEQIEMQLEEHSNALAWVYEFGNEKGFISSWMMSGIRIPGDEDHFYGIQVGINECELLKIAVGSDGKGKTIEREDIRHLQELETANMGTIKIRKRRAASRLLPELKSIKAYLVSVDGEYVEKTLSV